MITFEAPLALGLLALPLAVAWLAARDRRAEEEATGTVELWRHVAQATQSTAERRRRPPLALWLLVASLVAGVLALAQPRWEGRGAPSGWRFVVDRSPSMYLADGGRTRLDVALERLAAELGPLEGEWVAVSGRETCAVARGEFPASWREAPAGSWDEPEWARFDAMGSVWITDASAGAIPAAAGRVASGGAAVPGVVAVDDTGRWLFDGRELVREAPSTPEPVKVALDPRLREGPLGRAFLAWAQARGFDVVENGGGARLVVELAPDGEPVEGEVSGPGFRARARARPVAAFEGVPARRLVELRGECVARATFGRVRVGFEELGPIEGDGTAFALAWAREFDTWMLVEGVSVRERAAAGEGSWKAPSAAQESARLPREQALFAAAAALLALAALVARRA